jgi:hypothetical protein
LFNHLLRINPFVFRIRISDVLQTTNATNPTTLSTLPIITNDGIAAILPIGSNGLNKNTTSTEDDADPTHLLSLALSYLLLLFCAYFDIKYGAINNNSTFRLEFY